MPIKEMPKFIATHREVRQTLLCALGAAAMLIVQFILMPRTVLTVAFDVVIPFTSVITFACYAITMAYNRPQILICPPMVYFISLLINQLFSVEVKVSETYPIFTLIELIPFLCYCFSVLTLKGKKVTAVVLKSGCVLIVLACVALLILAFVFHYSLYTDYTKNIAQCAGMVSVMFIYVGMLCQLKIAGTALPAV